jgi:hypothetical protein
VALWDGSTTGIKGDVKRDDQRDWPSESHFSRMVVTQRVGGLQEQFLEFLGSGRMMTRGNGWKYEVHDCLWGFSGAVDCWTMKGNQREDRFRKLLLVYRGDHCQSLAETWKNVRESARKGGDSCGEGNFELLWHQRLFRGKALNKGSLEHWYSGVYYSEGTATKIQNGQTSRICDGRETRSKQRCTNTEKGGKYLKLSITYALIPLKIS